MHSTLQAAILSITDEMYNVARDFSIVWGCGCFVVLSLLSLALLFRITGYQKADGAHILLAIFAIGFTAVGVVSYLRAVQEQAVSFQDATAIGQVLQHDFSLSYDGNKDQFNLSGLTAPAHNETILGKTVAIPVQTYEIGFTRDQIERLNRAMLADADPQMRQKAAQFVSQP